MTKAERKDRITSLCNQFLQVSDIDQLATIKQLIFHELSSFTYKPQFKTTDTVIQTWTKDLDIYILALKTNTLDERVVMYTELSMKAMIRLVDLSM